VTDLHRDFDGPVPEYLTRRQASGNVFRDADCWCFHTAAWWRALWSRYPFVVVEACESMADGGAPVRRVSAGDQPNAARMRSV
jgi:hypothetical protein